MKNLLVFLMAFAVLGTASATTVTNGEFTVDNAEWNFGGGAGFVADHNTSGGNPGGFTILETPGGVGSWGAAWQVGLEDFDVLGIPAGTAVTMQCDVKAIGTSGVTGAYLKIETHNAIGWLSEWEDSIGPLTTSWAPYSIDYTSDAGGIGLKCVISSKESFDGPTEHGFDNVEILVQGGTPALRPVPINNAGVSTTTTTSLSWENPAGATTADVYLQTCDDPCGSPDPCGSGVLIADDTAAESVAYALAVDKHYYWVVDANVSGSPVLGFVWYFQTTDQAPDVNAGADQYLVSTPSPMDITLDANVTDNNLPSVTYLWTDITVAADKDPDTTVTINAPTTEDPNVTLTNTVNGAVTGYYQFTLTVTDSPLGQVTADSIIVGVYGTCAEAATEDPCDAYDDTGDNNGDCKKDLKDLALLGAVWLDCNANRIACP